MKRNSTKPTTVKNEMPAKKEEEEAAITEAEIDTIKAYGKNPYQEKLKTLNQDIDKLLKNINELSGIQESDTGLLPRQMWDLPADMRAKKEEEPLKIGHVVKILPKQSKGTGGPEDELPRYVLNFKQSGKFVVGLDKELAPDAIEENMRVGTHRQDYRIILPRQPHVTSNVALMQLEQKPDITYADIGGCKEQIEKLREIVELPLLHPQKFEKLGLDPPKGVLMYGPPGTGKTLCARAIANRTDACFIKVNGSELVQRYVGEGARLIREIFALAKQKKLCIIFFDEIDAFGGARFKESEDVEHDVQRTMLELVNQLDGFDQRGNIKVLMATNRADTLDPALLRPGRLDRKIEFKLPDLEGRQRIFEIHSKPMSVRRDIRFGMMARLCPNATGADIRSVCTEAGMFAIRDRRKAGTEKDFLRAIDKVIKSYAKFSATPRYITHN